MREEIKVLIIELSRQTGASVRSIRYYETKKLLSSKRLDNGYRDYDDNAIDRVKIIQFYLNLGLNTDEIIQIIDCPTSIQDDRPLCKLAYELYKVKLDEVNSKIEILNSVRLRLLEKIKEFEKANL